MNLLMRRKVTTLATAGLMLVVGVSAWSFFTVGDAQRSGASSPPINCGRGVPVEKCNPPFESTIPTLPTTNPLPTSNAPTGPQGVACGSGFLSPQQVLELQNQFGSLQCFSLIGSNQWIVIGDGMTINPSAIPPPATPGGSIIAVETCNANDVSCLSPDTQHDFAQFTVFYPPNPSTGDMGLMTTPGSHLINVADGSCGPFTFDSSNGEWFLTSPATIAALTSGGVLPPAAVSPAPVTGATAIGSLAPSPDLESCFVG